MDNEYNYYIPNQPGTPDPSGNGNNKKVKNKMKIPKIVKVMGVAVVFGVVASAVFQTGNFLGNKVLGVAGNIRQSEPLSNTQLSQSASAAMPESNVTEVANNAMPSLVSITSMSVQQVQNFFGGTSAQESESAGSGIIIGKNDTELLIATNNHVVQGSETLTVTFIDEQSAEAQVKGTDATKDLAVVAVPIESIKSGTMESIKVATMGDSSELSAGDTAIAIGNSLGYGQSVTSGIISATERHLQTSGVGLIQTDAAINPGNSGGALLNARGEVIGINSAKIANEAIEGIGYAIPISEISKDLDTMMNQQTRSKVAEGEKGYLGIKGVDVTQESAQMYSMPTGVYVSEAISGGGAKAAGVKKGDIIAALDGTNITSMTELQNRLQYYKAGEKIKVTIQVQGNDGEYKEKTVEIVLGKNA